jgi:PST family polysaccharide transporter
MLVGRFIGAASLGLYSRAYSLFALPMTQIRGPLGDVSMPALSSLKDQPERYLLYYRRFLGALAFATVPLSAYCALEGDFLIATLMGPKWAAAAPVFRILAAAGVIQTIASTRGLVLLSLGKSRRYLWLGVANSVAMVASFVIGLPFGIVGVAVAYAVANLVVLVPSLVYTFRGTPVTVRAFFTVLLEPVAYAVLSAALATGALWLLGRDGLLPHALALAVFFGTYALLAWRSAAFRGIWRAFASGLASAPPAAVAADAGGEFL